MLPAPIRASERALRGVIVVVLPFLNKQLPLPAVSRQQCAKGTCELPCAGLQACLREQANLCFGLSRRRIQSGDAVVAGRVRRSARGAFPGCRWRQPASGKRGDGGHVIALVFVFMVVVCRHTTWLDYQQHAIALSMCL
ncbi:hypothetical protein D9M68_780070 [compost metagenome]